MAIEQGGFLKVLILLWHGPTFYDGHLRFTDTCCRALDSETFPLFNDLGPSRPEIEPWFTACEMNALPLRHRINLFKKIHVSTSSWLAIYLVSRHLMKEVCQGLHVCMISCWCLYIRSIAPGRFFNSGRKKKIKYLE